MPIVDYSTPRRGEDLTSPNAGQPKDTVVLPSSEVHQTTRVIEESLFITERVGPVILKSGEAIDVVSLTGEAGDIVSIEVVTDNPYTGVYLEMDDYKNKDGVGITAAELIMKNRITPSDREFYAEDMREDGTFVVKYSPSSPDPYSDRLKFQVRNDVRPLTSLYGQVTGQSFKMRGGLPVPLELGFAGGHYVTHPNLASVTIAETPTVLRKLGRNGYFSPIRNLEALKDPTVAVGAYHPYMGIASDVTFTPNDNTTTNKRVVSGAPGEQVLSTTGFPTPNTVAWPGKHVSGTFTPSEQQFVIYPTKAEDESATGLTGGGRLEAGTPIFIKIGDTVYFPGTASLTTHYYDAGNSRWQEDGNNHEQGTDGAYLLTVSPGLPFKLPKLDEPLNDSGAAGTNYDGWGVIVSDVRQKTEQMLIHEVVIRRKRTRFLKK